jgi:hypothetical protein
MRAPQKRSSSAPLTRSVDPAVLDLRSDEVVRFRVYSDSGPGANPNAREPLTQPAENEPRRFTRHATEAKADTSS